MSDPAADLLQLERIKTLKYTYWRASDAKDPELFRACFTRTGSSIDYGRLGRTDADGMTAVFRRIALQTVEGTHVVLDMHHGFHPVITLVSDAEAMGRWTLRFRQVNQVQNTEKVLSGEYNDHYVVEDGEWKIQRCTFTESWSITRPLGDAIVQENQ